MRFLNQALSSVHLAVIHVVSRALAAYRGRRVPPATPVGHSELRDALNPVVFYHMMPSLTGAAVGTAGAPIRHQLTFLCILACGVRTLLAGRLIPTCRLFFRLVLLARI